jgi:hypothetical protein
LTLDDWGRIPYNIDRGEHILQFRKSRSAMVKKRAILPQKLKVEIAFQTYRESFPATDQQGCCETGEMGQKHPQGAKYDESMEPHRPAIATLG